MDRDTLATKAPNSSSVMEEPQEVHTDENKALSEKKPKRIVKTPAQVVALENFYNEHKYPTEIMKAELAESIGLTEKQVSGWFCHRRLKDKKLPNDEVGPLGKQDRSSGVIQDRGSGLRQDSCGSTKQGDNKNYDLKEVESRRFTTTSLLPIEVQFDHGSQHNNIMGMDDDHDDDDDDDDDTSSGSSSPLNDNFHPQNVDCLGSLTTKYPTHNDLKSVKSRTGPSGYLKVKGQVENVAITAVKRQLGRNYREDGPPLGIEFEPLPPGAFENPIKIPVNQSYYVGDRSALHPLDGSKTFQLSNGSKMHERYNPKSYDPMDLDESAGLEIRHASKHHEKSQYKPAPNISKHSRHSLSERSLQMVVVNDDSAGETSVPDNQFETRMKHGPGIVRRPDSLSNHHHHQIGYGKNFDGKQAENYTRNGPPKVNYRDRVEPLTTDFTYKRGDVLQLDDRVLSRKAPKDAGFDRERRGIDGYSKLVSPKIHPGKEMRVNKRSREDFMHQVYPRKETLVDFPPIINKTKRSSAQMTPSFSDDETAETTSSGE